MSKKSGGLPRDTLFRPTDVQDKPASEAKEAVEDALPQKKAKSKPRTKQVNKSRSKQRDSEMSPVADGAVEKQKTTELPRQTYYVPADLHKQLRLLALEQEMNVSDLVVEGIGWVLGKYGK